MSEFSQLHVLVKRQAHKRYRILCIEQGKIMGQEVRRFIDGRIEQLEKQKGNNQVKKSNKK
jgi:hypothetical protein